MIERKMTHYCQFAEVIRVDLSYHLPRHGNLKAGLSFRERRDVFIPS